MAFVIASCMEEGVYPYDYRTVYVERGVADTIEEVNEKLQQFDSTKGLVVLKVIPITVRVEVKE